MKHFKSSLLAMLLGLCCASIGYAQGIDADWATLNRKTAELYRAGQYADAEMVAKRALEIAQKNVDAKHPDLATSLNNLAVIYRAQGLIAQAEPLHQRALAIREKAFGPDHPAIVTSLNNLAEIYKVKGNFAQSEALFQRALAIRAHTLSPNHPNIVASLNNLAGVYDAQGKFAQAEPLYKRLLAIDAATLGPNNPDFAVRLNNLAARYFAQAWFAQAEPLYQRALAINEKSLGKNHPEVATTLNNLAELWRAQAQYARAEPLYKRALSIREKALGPSHPEVAASLNNLAELYRAQAQYGAAEPLYKRALTIWEKTLGPNHPNLGTGLNNLALLYKAQGQYAKAEPLLQRSLAIDEAALGPNHRDVAADLSSLAALYQKEGRYSQAEPLYQRALSIYEKALGAEHPDAATAMNSLAELYDAQGRYTQAEPIYKHALAIREKTLGLKHPDVAQSLSSLAFHFQSQGRCKQAEPFYERALSIDETVFGANTPRIAANLNNLAACNYAQGQYAEAEARYQRALAIVEKAYGAEHLEVASELSNLAILYKAQARYKQAEPLYQRALAIKQKALGTNHPAVALSVNNLAALYEIQGAYAQAEPFYQRALAINENTLGQDHPTLALSLNNLASLYAREGQYAAALPLARRASAIYRQRVVAGGADDASIQESKQNRDGFFAHLSLLTRNPAKAARAGLVDESFQVLQLEQATGTSAAVAKMALRFSTGDDAIAALVKRKQDALERRANTEASLLRAASQVPDQRNAADERKLRDAIMHLGQEIHTLDAELDKRFPEYQELTRPQPLSVRQVQAFLHPNEALLVYAISENQSWLWVVRPDQALFLDLNVKQKDLSEKIKAIRTQTAVPDTEQLRKVDVATLYLLYQQLFAPALPHLQGVQHIMEVPAGPLQSVPLSMLVASPPKEIKTDADYREVDWLIEHYAISVLPSVSSIRAFRQFAKTGTAQKPFIGFGDPLLQDDSAATRKLLLAGLFRSTTGAARNNRQTDIADVDMLRRQYRLPESAEEIKAMAKIVNAEANDVLLQDQATETKVKSLDLAQYRILAFATHGVMADEIGSGFEPGLILTPPKQGTRQDDGYLAAGEIAQLKLNADWVLLSACNTAAADGTPGAEGLSGLAKAFFYAGSRSLLVSHWPVSSQATVPLTTGMLREYAAHPELGKAAAQRKAMLALMNTPKHPEYAHPLYWAPFVVVGEGGAGRSGRQ